MKSGKFFFIAIIFALTATVFASQPAAIHGRASFGVFYSQLNPYGSWMQMNDGLVVWRPRVAARWSPYTYGSWVWTDCGWYWNSDEGFGDIVYHYGRWYNDDYYGWIWVPDYEWAPAWVQWRYNDDYIGWTPLPPYASFSMTVGISFSEGFSIGYDRWHFVRYHDFCHPQIGRYFVPGRQKVRFFNNTRESHVYVYENNRVVNRNIPRTMFEARANIRLTENRINFRESESIERSQVRGSENRIEVSVPRANTTRVDINTLTINRADRGSSLKLDRVQIGERVRNTGAAPQRNDQGAVQQARPAGRPNNTPSVTPNRGSRQNNPAVNQNRNNPDRQRKNQDRQDRKEVKQEIKESRNAEKDVRRETRQENHEDENRESRSRTR
jgi:hypothetical protein